MNGFLEPNEDGLQLLNKIANPSLFKNRVKGSLIVVIAIMKF